ncbi:hypothetical protein CVIRNUC_002568 [Coccomyxa viridis]|uniref:Protein N-terminal glutamine amidohydrolase n=1 Tax=Coccomyxa viridis TaxID=1274662 RepID=A0AAV1HXS5_9CHLO|nr:hypothetical protein CVIRNUC_002568 [Coccomyxa viridis]
MHVQPFAYCPYYCEENIYKLCQTFAADDGYNKELSVVFISNDEGKVPIQRQTVAENVGGTVVWDYHVIAVERDGDTSVIYDLTSQLPRPCPVALYARQALGPANTWRFTRMFRVIPAALYLEHFASDRSHMLDASSLSDPPVYNRPPPDYPCIVSRSGDIMTLPFYWTMHNDGVAYTDGRYGRVYSEDAFMMMHGAYAGNGTA